MRSVFNRLWRQTIFRSAIIVLLLMVLTSCSRYNIFDATENGDLEKVKSLLKDNPDLVFSKDTNGATPLFWAAANGRKNVAELLLTDKADVNAKDNQGETPLHEAAWDGNEAIAERLLAGK